MNRFGRVWLGLCAVAAAPAPSWGQGAFTVVALPDTQNYVTSSTNTRLFEQQTAWIADQVTNGGNPRNIRFVTHLGDVVSNGDSLTQMVRADRAMDTLDGVVPYGVLPGNHDYASTGVKTTGADLYETYFGPDRFAGYDWYGGADPSGLNSYQRFSAGGYDFLHLSLEWQPTINAPFREVSPIEWAQSVIDANPHTPVILSTHEYVDDRPAGRSGAGDALWDELVRRNDQVFMVLNGHFHSVGGTNDGEHHQTSLNDAGRPVFEVLQDYQDYPRGGDGWLRLIEFDPAAGRVNFETYSPVLDAFQTETVAQVGGFASQFSLDLDFEDRLAPVIIPPDPVDPATTPRFFFQNGREGYDGATDKEVRSSGGDAFNANAETISVDGDDGSPGLQPNQGLIRFDDLVSGDLPAGAQIAAATLSLEVVNPGSGFAVHEMLADWDTQTTWQSLGGGAQADGVEAASSAVATLGANNGDSNVGVGRLEIDVTASVQAWLDGERSNRGWVLLPYPSGTNGVDFFTSDFADVDARPSLAIITTPGDYDLDGAVDAEDLAAWRADYGREGFSLADGNRDGVVDAADYVFARNLIDRPAEAVPEPGASAAATLAVGWLTRRRPRRRGAPRPSLVA